MLMRSGLGTGMSPSCTLCPPLWHPSLEAPSPRPPGAGFVQLVTTQRFDSKAGKPNDNFNFGLTLVGPLKLPVSGALSTSYTAAFRRSQRAAATAALTASGGSSLQA